MPPLRPRVFSESALDDLLAVNPDTVTNKGTNTFTTASGAEITITLDEDNNDILVIGDGNVAAGLGRAKVVLP
ncbi:hypothetical protein ACA910_018361 [Epithemia clementina (nom. ined.)]